MDNDLVTLAKRMTGENPLDTPEMKREIKQLNKNLQNPAINVSKLMHTITMGTAWVSPAEKNRRLGEERKRGGVFNKYL